MSRKYSAWASNHPDPTTLKLVTVHGGEQDQIKKLERVEAIPHMYMNVDAPPPPPSSRSNALATHASVPTRTSMPYFIAPNNVVPPSSGGTTKLWPSEKSIKALSSSESGMSTVKLNHKHKQQQHHHHHHHHHRHHGGKHHHHHHHNRRNRAKSVETIRNRPHQTLLSPSKVMFASPQMMGQEQQQQQEQQQPMIVYRQVPEGGSYTVDTSSASVPFGMQNETTLVDDQQAPVFVYRDAESQQQQLIGADSVSQQVFVDQGQETIIQQADPMACISSPQQSQFLYCTDPNQQDYLCSSTTTAGNFIQQTSPQQQYFCVDNTSTTLQPTFINQIPVFNPLTTNTAQTQLCLPQTQLQRTASVIVQQQQQQPQQLQIIQSAPSAQIIQPAQQVFQTVASAPHIFQTIQPQIIQQAPLVQSIQAPTTAMISAAPTVAASPQILYQRPYDPIVIPFQNQQFAVARAPQVAISRPSYAPAPIISARPTPQPQGPNMFRHALLRTVANQTGLPMLSPSVNTTGNVGLQLVRPPMMSSTGPAPLGTTANVLGAGSALQRSTSLPIVPLTPGGLLIPFQPSRIPQGMIRGILPRTVGTPSSLLNFADLRQQQLQNRAQLLSMQQRLNRIPSPPVFSAARSPLGPIRTPYTSGIPSGLPPISNRTPYTSGIPTGLPSGPIRTPYSSGISGTPYSNNNNIFASSGSSAGTYSPISRPQSTGLSYAQPSFGDSRGASILSGSSLPYNTFRP